MSKELIEEALHNAKLIEMNMRLVTTGRNKIDDVDLIELTKSQAMAIVKNLQEASERFDI